MKKRQFGQVIRSDGPTTHLKKAGTPTCGGILIFFAIVVSLLVAGNFYSYPLWGAIVIMTSFFLLGFLDDFSKILKKNSKGISAKVKLLWQFVSVGAVLFFLIQHGHINTSIYVPFTKESLFDFGQWYILFGSLVIVGSSNAVNLTDGLDGLATGPIISSAVTLAILAYLSGHKDIAAYLYIPYIGHGGELAVLASALVGAGVGFLWFNAFPAEIMMGDVGSLPIGGILGTIAVITKNEILFVFIGGIFVAEALSVIIQVASFKLRGKRIFKMAPIHHHFELLGWPEPKVIVRFWIISIVLSILSLATLKTR